MKKLFYFILFTIIFTSCDKSGDLSSGGTLKITSSTGSSKTLSNYKQALVAGSWYCVIDEPTSTDNYYWLAIGGLTDSGLVNINVGIPTIQTGVVYSYSTNGGATTAGVSIDFEDWIEADYANATKATIEFSKFQYPGHIVGVVINYDKTGKVLSKGEFDFVSTKSQI